MQWGRSCIFVYRYGETYFPKGKVRKSPGSFHYPQIRFVAIHHRRRSISNFPSHLCTLLKCKRKIQDYPHCFSIGILEPVWISWSGLEKIRDSLRRSGTGRSINFTLDVTTRDFSDVSTMGNLKVREEFPIDSLCRATGDTEVLPAHFLIPGMGFLAVNAFVFKAHSF